MKCAIRITNMAPRSVMLVFWNGIVGEFLSWDALDREHSTVCRFYIRGYTHEPSTEIEREAAMRDAKHYEAHYGVKLEIVPFDELLGEEAELELAG